MTRISEAVECLENLGYTVTPPAVLAAPVETPGEPGLYEDTDGDVWMQDADHVWFCLTEMHRPCRSTSLVDPILYAPFTKLERVPDIAKRVLEAVRDRAITSHPHNDMTIRYLVLDNIADEFGVTDR